MNWFFERGENVSPAKRGRLRLAAALVTLPLVLGGLFSACGAGEDPADLILKNGHVHTADGSQSEAEAVAVRDGKIVFVGSSSEINAFLGMGTEVIDLQGKTVLPGFIDGHNHVSDHPEPLFWLTTRPYETLKEIGSALKEYRAKDPTMRQLRAIGWNPAMLKAAMAETGLTPVQLLDQYISDIPVVLLHDWHHDMWVNSLALKNAGIDENTPNPPGAFIERVPGTPGHGTPNGVVREFGAMSMIENALPFSEFTKEQFRAAILDWQKLAAVRGVTSVVVPQPRPTVNFYEALQELDDEGLLTVRYDVAIWANETRGTEQLPEILATRDKYQGTMFNLDTVKIFGTGASAWATSDLLVWNQERLNKTVAALDKEGLRVYIHDIGPVESYKAMLDAFAYALDQNGARDARHTITHVSSRANGTINRFKQLKVRADGHPVPKEFFDAGIEVTLSSDYPVREFFPTTRLGQAVANGVSLVDAIAAHTIEGAELMFAEDITGSIVPGKAADLVVFGEDLFGMTADQIRAAKPVMTVSGGKVVFRNPSMGGDSLQRAAARAVAPVKGEEAHKH